MKLRAAQKRPIGAADAANLIAHRWGGSNVTEDWSLKTVTFDKSKLLSVSKDGLEYVDDQGCRCVVDFHTRRENVQKELGSGRWQPKPSSDSLTWYVGFRDIEAKHITLATNPPTRFVFPMPDPNSFREFQEFQYRLFREAGVKTLDMN